MWEMRRISRLVFFTLLVMAWATPVLGQDAAPIAADRFDAIRQELIDFGEALREAEATLPDLGDGDRFFLAHMDEGRRKLLLLAPLAGSLDSSLGGSIDGAQGGCGQVLAPTLDVLFGQIENERFLVAEIVDANDQVRPEIVELVGGFLAIVADLSQAVDQTRGRLDLE